MPKRLNLQHKQEEEQEQEQQEELKEIKKLAVKEVRCNRSRMQWELELENGGTIYLTEGIMEATRFTCNATGRNIGCGGESEYAGVASGILDPDVRPQDLEGGRLLEFDRYDGEFRDALTNEVLDEVERLALLPNCSALYWPKKD